MTTLLVSPLFMSLATMITQTCLCPLPSTMLSRETSIPIPIPTPLIIQKSSPTSLGKHIVFYFFLVFVFNNNLHHKSHVHCFCNNDSVQSISSNVRCILSQRVLWLTEIHIAFILLTHFASICNQGVSIYKNSEWFFSSFDNYSGSEISPAPSWHVSFSPNGLMFYE